MSWTPHANRLADDSFRFLRRPRVGPRGPGDPRAGRLLQVVGQQRADPLG